MSHIEHILKFRWPLNAFVMQYYIWVRKLAEMVWLPKVVANIGKLKWRNKNKKTSIKFAEIILVRVQYKYLNIKKVESKPLNVWVGAVDTGSIRLYKMTHPVKGLDNVFFCFFFQLRKLDQPSILLAAPRTTTWRSLHSQSVYIQARMPRKQDGAQALAVLK